MRTGILLVLLLALPVVARAQFVYTTNIGTITITGYTGSGGDLVIPDEIDALPVTSIGDWTFQYCSNLTSVTLGTNITTTGDYVFYSCTNLVRASIAGHLTRLSNGLFCYCSSLTNAPIPGTVTSLGYSVFLGCTSLRRVAIPSGVTSIGDYSFVACASLTNVTIPASLSSIGTRAFDQCPSLREFAVDPLNPYYSTVDGVLFNKNQFMILTYPQGKGRSYTIPGSTTIIGSSAFAHGGSLTNVIIPSTVTDIWDRAFEHCTGLATITLPNRLAHIGPGAFDFCCSLRGITIPNSVTRIDNWAFGNCTSLTSFFIPSGVTSLGNSVFDNCYSLAAITVDASNPAYCSVDGILFNKSMSAILLYPEAKAGTTYRIPDGVTTLGESAFYYCTGLVSIVLPASVTTIQNMVFYLCTRLSGVYFEGNAPTVGVNTFTSYPMVYYLPGTMGWGPTFAGTQTAPWPPPDIDKPPQTQTAEVGSLVELQVKSSTLLRSASCWFFNQTNSLGCTTDYRLQIPDVQFGQSGAYTVVISNAAGVVTSPPALLAVIPLIPRQPAAAVRITGELGTLVNVDYADYLGFPPTWAFQSSAGLTSTSQYYFDVSMPLPPQRFYRAWQAATPSVVPSLRMVGVVPAITLTGNTGNSVRVDGINRYGATDAWFTLDTVTLTNTSQLYFDTSAWRQPERLYRLVPLP